MPRRPIIRVVEDDFAVRQTVHTYLAEQDYEVIEAENGDSAMPILESDEPLDLLLTDIVMPGARDGFALARDARRLRPALRVLHITGYPELLDKPGNAAATEEVLRKPFRPAELLARIGILLGRWSVDRNPILRRAYEYWHEKAAGRRAPDRRDLDPSEVKDILPYLSILDIVTAGGETLHFYRLVGTRVVEALGYNPTNHNVEEFAHNGHVEFLKRLLLEVAVSGRPLYAASSFRSSTAGISTERVLLPFTRGGADIRQIVMVQTFDWIRRKRTIHELTQAHGVWRDSIEHPPDAPRDAGPAHE
jgi:DNA-binding response OmpR family regulator